jgi:hypothetical protein
MQALASSRDALFGVQRGRTADDDKIQGLVI